MLVPVLLFFAFAVAVAVPVVFGILTAMKSAKESARKLKVAKRAYEMSLAQLKKTPTSPDARQAALELGRNYSALTRDNKNVTIFDEIALKNDIDAACAGATAVAPSSRSKRSERECPHCAETILVKAIICRFCNNKV